MRLMAIWFDFRLYVTTVFIPWAEAIAVPYHRFVDGGIIPDSSATLSPLSIAGSYFSSSDKSVLCFQAQAAAVGRP